MLTRRNFLKGGFLSGCTLLFTDSLFFERYFVETNEFDIGDRNNSGPNIKLLQISDLHIRELNWLHRSLAEQVNSLAPDLILLTGDMIEKKAGMRTLDSFLKLLKHDTPKVAITGNWEHWSRVNIEKLKEVYLDNNCNLLLNQSRAFTFKDRKLVITGLDDMLEGDPDIAAAVSGLGAEPNHIALCHCPEQRDDIEKRAERINRDRNEKEKLKIDYVFSGHSHGGQINIFGFTPFLPKGIGKYVKGWYSEKQPAMYVSKGIGTSIIPVRVGARAEITVFKYRLA